MGKQNFQSGLFGVGLLTVKIKKESSFQKYLNFYLIVYFTNFFAWIHFHFIEYLQWVYKPDTVYPMRIIHSGSWLISHIQCIETSVGNKIQPTFSDD